MVSGLHPTLAATENVVSSNYTRPFYGSMEFVRDNPSDPVPEETFTH